MTDEMDTPYSLVWLDEVPSTQDVARSLLSENPVLVVTGRQTAGRGRSGARWDSATIGLAASLAYRHRSVLGLTVVPALAGLAAASAWGVALKWPNDLMTGGDKVGGILSEASGDSVVVGLGLNLWWPDAPAGRAGIFSEAPTAPDLAAMAGIWATELLSLLAGRAWPRADYERLCVTIGKPITWHPNGAGLALGVDDDGGLVVETTSGRVIIHSGSVNHVRE